MHALKFLDKEGNLFSTLDCFTFNFILISPEQKMAEDLETYHLLFPNHDIKNRLSLEQTRIRLQSVILYLASMEVRGSGLPAGTAGVCMQDSHTEKRQMCDPRLPFLSFPAL